MRYIFDQTKTIDSSAIYDENLYRQLKLLSNVGPAALPADQLDRVCFLRIYKMKYKTSVNSSSLRFFQLNMYTHEMCISFLFFSCISINLHMTINIEIIIYSTSHIKFD